MVTVITRDNIGKITNDGLRKDVEFYLQMYENFLDELAMFGISVDDHNDRPEKAELVNELKKLGVEVRNAGKSFIWGNISPSCIDCRTGEGSATYILSLKCNRDCFFCTNKNQFNYDELQTKTQDIIGQFKKTNSHYKTMKSAAITGGEPLLFPDECEDFIKYTKKINKKTQTRIYTNGDLADERLMERLGKAGLDEIRFGLKPGDDGTVEEAVLINLENAKKYIPRVMVEMPCKPGQLENMKKLLDRLEKIGIFSINILEFLFPWVHVKEYTDAGYKVRNHPYEILFDYTYAGGVPVAGSEIECLKLLKYAAEKKYKMGVHYCSLENKLTAQVWHHNHKFKKTPVEHFSEEDFFVRTAKAYGEDAHKVKEILDKNKCKSYIYNKADERVEFPPENIPLLAGTNMQLGIGVMVLDRQDDKNCVREIAVHVTDSESFSMSDI